MLSILESFVNLFNTAIKPPQQYIYSKDQYHPIYGQPGRVDNPSVNINTFFGSKIPYIEHLNGPLDRHLVTTPYYKQAWAQRKKMSYYNSDQITQISPYANPFIIGKRLDYGNGKSISSRNQKERKNSFYDTIGRHKKSLSIF
jgi:hypothetical protein